LNKPISIISRLFTYLLLLIFLTGKSALANEHTVSLDITSKDNTYITKLSSLINTPPSRLFELLTKYDKLHSYSRLIRKSELLPNGHLSLQLETCFIFICFKKKQVLALSISEHSIIGKIIPEQSDFASGFIHWTIHKKNNKSHLQINSEITPKFWIPPLIGPLLIKQKLRNEALYSVEQLEQQAYID